MTNSKRTSTAQRYTLKITLRNVKPAIWRRFWVPGDIRLDRLHEVIQTVMGWTNSHLHLFDFDGQTFTSAPEGPFEGLEERKYRLSDLIFEAKSRFGYTYDFGDGWEHVIVVEKVEPTEHASTPFCLTGKRRCPPEDVGGPFGYTDFLTAYQDPKHPEHAHFREWFGDGFDPDEFDPDAINDALR